MTNEVDRLLGNSQPPTPPPELRDRTLRAAIDALGRAPMPDRWTRIWQNRPLRFAWATSIAGLLLAHALISYPPRSSPVADRGFVLHQVSRTTDAEIQAIATMIRLDLDANALGGRAVAVGAPRENPDPRTENKKETIR